MTQDDYVDRGVKESIHSGHFMVSDIDDSEDNTCADANQDTIKQENEDNHSTLLNDVRVSNSLDHQVGGFDFQSACKETSKTYTFGSRSSQAISIDASLSRLFQCMTVAYR